jgi:hypothetical protein
MSCSTSYLKGLHMRHKIRDSEMRESIRYLDLWSLFSSGDCD